MTFQQPLNLGHATASAFADKRTRAQALARLLMHAMLDAEALGADNAAEKIRDGIELIRKKFDVEGDEFDFYE